MPPEVPAGRKAACRDLARRIERLWRRGLRIDPKTFGYMETVLSPNPVSGLIPILSDPDHDARQPLMELLFFPDDAFRVELEPFLEEADFHEEDAHRVLEALMERRPEVLLMFPGDTPSLRFPVPKDAAALFIRRLALSRHLDPGILKTVDAAATVLPEGPDTDSSTLQTGRFRRDQVKAMIRHSRLSGSVRGMAALHAFLLHFPLHAPDFFPCFSFFIDFLESATEDSDPGQGLEKLQRLYRKGLEQGMLALEILDKQNPETRILSGARFPHVDCRELMEKIDCIDRIRIRVFPELRQEAKERHELPDV